jgi:hypothetical protein
MFPSTGVQCVWAALKVTSTFNTDGQPITLTTTKQPFTYNKTLSNPACPKSGTLSGTWTLTTISPAGNQAPIYLGTS